MGQFRHILWPVLIWLAVGAVIIALMDTPAWSAKTFERVTNDEWVATGVLLSTVVMLTLMGFYISMLVRAWLTMAALPFVRLFLAGAVAVVVYNVNVLLKDNYQQTRPCHEIQIATECPPLENFSYPSNHTVIAFGLVAGLVFAMPRTAYIVLPLGVLEGVSRVIAGHHYPHDVLAGATLGMLGVLGVMLASQPLQHRLAKRLSTTRMARAESTTRSVS
jgi:undecaprenyl-diphosphatase